MHKKEDYYRNHCDRLCAFAKMVEKDLNIVFLEDRRNNSSDYYLYMMDTFGQKYKMYGCDANCQGRHTVDWDDCSFTFENIKRRIDSMEIVDNKKLHKQGKDYDYEDQDVPF